MTNAETLVAWTAMPIGTQIYRIRRTDTGRVLGYVEQHGVGSRSVWIASASMRAFRGTGPASAEPADEYVPVALYAPLRASEGHDYLPGTFRTRPLAVAALQRYLTEQRAPVMGYDPHPDVQHKKA